MAIRLDGFAVALPMGLDEVEEMGAWVFGRDAFRLSDSNREILGVKE